ncbi:MAG TPA: hypothetical protein EYP10_12100 [Armatimonadetes bacterium]|nr:hypothetical protein [Armatimonadota bacterium]
MHCKSKAVILREHSHILQELIRILQEHSVAINEFEEEVHKMHQTLSVIGTPCYWCEATFDDYQSIR